MHTYDDQADGSAAHSSQPAGWQRDTLMVTMACGWQLNNSQRTRDKGGTRLECGSAMIMVVHG
ncbi:hypothetical protein [Tunturiibacter lichenicola]|uniref:hypothetical protein n=1 Tax=Tunturiibacter lichenicola TaxID=2051959 RepID=UPI003D9BAC35